MTIKTDQRKALDQSGAQIRKSGRKWRVLQSRLEHEQRTEAK